MPFSTSCLAESSICSVRLSGQANKVLRLAEKVSKKIPGKPFRGQAAPEKAYDHLKKNHGVDPEVASNRLHRLKEQTGMGPTDNVAIGKTGDVYNAQTGERLGSLTDKSLGGTKR
jgi:phosphopentomutase